MTNRNNWLQKKVNQMNQRFYIFSISPFFHMNITWNCIGEIYKSLIQTIWLLCCNKLRWFFLILILSAEYLTWEYMFKRLWFIKNNRKTLDIKTTLSRLWTEYSSVGLGHQQTRSVVYQRNKGMRWQLQLFFKVYYSIFDSLWNFIYFILWYRNKFILCKRTQGFMGFIKLCNYFISVECYYSILVDPSYA